MQFFIMFVFGAITVGAGSMMSPAWPSKQPRIALAGSLALAIIVGGAVFYASLFGWDTLVIDYLFFALLTTIFLGGTLSHAQARAEAKGEVLEDRDQGWPGPQDLVFLALIALLVAVPALALPVPAGEDAAGMAYLSLSTRFGGTFDTLAPFHPEVQAVYPPAFHVLTAYLSQQLNQPLSDIYMNVGAVMAFLCVWMAYDFGAELRDKRLGRAMGLALLGGLTLLYMVLESYYSDVMGLLFGMAASLYAIRYLRHQYPADLVAAGLMLGATMLASPAIFVLALSGFVIWLVITWLGPALGAEQARPTLRSWLPLVIGVPAIVIIATAPWTGNNLDVLRAHTATLDRDVPLQGLIVILPLAAFSLYLAWMKRINGAAQGVLIGLAWLLVVLDFAFIGVMATLLGPVLSPFLYYTSASQIVQFGLIVPLMIFGGIVLLWAWESGVPEGFKNLTYANFYIVAGVASVAVVGAILLAPMLIDNVGPAFISDGLSTTNADVNAMVWTKHNTPDDALILNYPIIGNWAAIITERDAVYHATLPFFSGDEVNPAGTLLADFWQNPGDEANLSLLREAGIDYVIVPQAASSPAALRGVFKVDAANLLAAPSAIEAMETYLDEVYNEDGAIVFAVPAGEPADAAD